MPSPLDDASQIKPFVLDAGLKRIGWNALMLILTTPCNILEPGSVLLTRLEVFGEVNSSTTFVELSLCNRCVKSIPSLPQHVAVRIPYDCKPGWTELSARLVSSVSPCPQNESSCILAKDLRHILVSPPNKSDPFASQDECLEKGFVCAPERVHVPRIVHFVFDVKGPPPRCPFFFYLGVRSAIVSLKPEVVFVHYHFEPRGRWWRRLIALPGVKAVFAALPSAIFGQPVAFYAHHSDLIRLHALARFGGVYLDSDLLVLGGLAPRLSAVPPCGALLGAQPFGWAGNGVIAAAPGAGLVARWLQTYETFSDSRRGFWGAMVPTMLAWAYPQQVLHPPPRVRRG
jgi:hypothetical protein